MKKIDRLLLTSFIGPFVVSFGIALFVLIMQFLWLYIDEIAGKGVSIFVMIELIAYLSISTFPMALPIAVLIASVMVMGTLAERYELSSMKSAGVSLLRVMRSLAFCAMGVAFFSYICSDFLIPISNLKFKSRLYDIRKQKPALTLEKGVFNEDFRQFVIRIGDKEKDGETIEDVMIEDQTNAGRTKFNKILADSGQMYTTNDKRYFVMNLFKGTIYQEPAQGQQQKQKYPFVRTNFGSWTKVWDMKEFDMTASDENRFKTQRSMLSMKQLQLNMDSLQKTMDANKQSIAEDLLLTVKRIAGKLETKKMVIPANVPITREDTTIKQLPVVPKLGIAPENKTKLGGLDTTAIKLAAKTKRQQGTTQNIPSGKRFDDFNASENDDELRKKVAELTQKTRKKEIVKPVLKAPAAKIPEIKKANQSVVKKEIPVPATPVIKPKIFRQELTKPINQYASFIETFAPEEREALMKEARPKAGLGKSIVSNQKGQIENKRREYVKTGYELFTKYSFALVCFIFLFIGAPMGAIIRKGGFGYPVLVSIVFFVGFIMLTILCRKFAELYILTPFWAAMVPCILLAPIGAFLTRKATNDSQMIDTDRLERWLKALIRVVRKLFRLPASAEV